MTDIMLKNVQELVASEEFGKEVEELETAEELQAAFARHGVELTPDEVTELCVGIASLNGELREDALDTVAGGVPGIITGALIIGGVWALSYGVGYVVGKVIKKKTGACSY